MVLTASEVCVWGGGGYVKGQGFTSSSDWLQLRSSQTGLSARSDWLNWKPGPAPTVLTVLFGASCSFTCLWEGLPVCPASRRVDSLVSDLCALIVKQEVRRVHRKSCPSVIGC